MAGPPSSTGDVFLYFLAIFLPPVAVFFKRGCSADVLINCLLWILGWIPGETIFLPEVSAKTKEEEGKARGEAMSLTT
ncbi:hypothetical protein L486_00830 [Kwoniella mangroviensis CBS 10435]|uniref:Stress response RCI peptide n=1 Tax=Kwoniella mangroviensis CBS 10435 TaxID=1331196 RepID=A0A1B9J069_9TREE|nr:hypothetical protein L486_00830 [Kwoniella mangroviensis CBS 10435]OCF77203.1 hypothetical protein I204_01188 [Kwoniella mangroviensis CBS 8886]